MATFCVAGSSVQLWAQTLGTMNMGGNPDFSADSIAQTSGPERRWHSFSGGRLSLNPSAAGTFVIDPTPADLALDLGGYVGSKVLRLPKVARMVLVDASGKELTPTSQRTDWFPYKLALHSQHTSGATMAADDFFVDADSSLLRVIDVRNAGTQKLQLSGSAPYKASVGWQAEKNAILVTGEDYYYSLCFASLSSAEGLPSPARSIPVCSTAGWKITLPLDNGNGRFAMGFGFATRGEGAQTAIARARNTISQPVSVSLANSQAVAEVFLRKVPAPTVWGLDPRLASGVTPEQQRQAYYIAWSFLQQSTINLLPEKPDFPFPQMSLGKAALWDGGEHRAPATCSWESFMGAQWLSLVDPASAWQIYAGIMSMVDADGLLGGESLPSRKAETAWKIYQQAPDRMRLTEVYPAIKRYLVWREANLRWIWGVDYNNPNERDLEFVVSWLCDLRFAARIATELGLTEDAVMWSSKEAPTVGKMRQWFFSDPERLHQLYYTDGTPDHSSGLPIMLLTALNIASLPDDMTARLIKLLNVTTPQMVNSGFSKTKYPDNQFVAMGLLDRQRPEARSFIEGILRDSILVGEFTECLVPGKNNLPALNGVKPSLFTALNIIDFTLLLNQVRCDTGRPQAFVVPAVTENFSPPRLTTINTTNGTTILNYDNPGNKYIDAGTLTVSGGTVTLGTYEGAPTTEFAMSGGLINIVSGTKLFNGGWSKGIWTNNKASLQVNGTLEARDGNNISADALTGSGAVTIGDLSWGTFNKSISVGVNGGGGTFSGTISDSGDDILGLIKAGGGTQILTGTNTYRGNTTVNGGKLAMTGTGKLYSNLDWANRNVTVQSGGVLEVNNWDPNGSLGQLGFDAGNLVINDGAIRYTGGNTTTPAESRGFTIGANGATLESAATTGQTWSINQDNRAGFFIGSTANGTLNLTGSGNGMISKIIPGGGGLTKNGSGTWTLSAGNTYTGATTVNGGKLAVTGTGKLYSNLDWANKTVTVQSGGVLEVANWDPNGSLGQLNFGAENIVINGGTIRYTGGNTTKPAESRGFTIGANGATLESAATTGQTWSINQDNRVGIFIGSTANGTLNLTGSGNGMISKVIPGGGGLTKNGNGTWTLSATNTYSGNTTVTSGTLRLGSASLANTSTVRISTGATLDLTYGSTDVIGTLFIGGLQRSAGIYKSSTGVGEGTVLTELTGTGKLQVTSGAATFESWINGYDFTAFLGANLSATGDADNDGTSNLIEQVFGTAPNAPTSGVTQVSASTNGFTFKHPLNPSLSSNVTFSYQWSSDLVEWKASGQSNSENTIVAIVPGTPVANVVTVTATITAGPSAKLYVRVIAVETL